LDGHEDSFPDLSAAVQNTIPMEYARLGTSDLNVSRIGFGCWAIGGHGYGVVDDKDSINAVEKALDLEINFFDTADIYGFGHSEMILSKALGSRRHDVVISTKFGVCWNEQGQIYKDISPSWAVKALEGSLRRLQLDCIPLYQIHWYDGKTPIEATMEVLSRCRDAGKIRYIGCSNLPLALIDAARKIDCLISIQSHFNVVQRQNEDLLRDCFISRSMGVLVYGVLARGLFSGKYDLKSQFGENDTRAIDGNFQGEKLTLNLSLANKLKKLGVLYQKSAAQIAIRWTLDAPFVTSALVGMKNMDQLVENIGALGWCLEEGDCKFLDSFRAY
jgi:aryl-alcohol dehydrogenase-like predicted oxidoreductase